VYSWLQQWQKENVGTSPIWLLYLVLSSLSFPVRGTCHRPSHLQEARHASWVGRVGEGQWSRCCSLGLIPGVALLRRWCRRISRSSASWLQTLPPREGGHTGSSSRHRRWPRRLRQQQQQQQQNWGLLMPDKWRECVWCVKVILKKDDRITLYCKGADSTIYPRLNPKCAELQQITTRHLSVRLLLISSSSCCCFRNRRWGGCVYVLQMFFFVFCFLLFAFCSFSVRHKIPDNRSRERLNGFSWNFYQTIAGAMEFATSCRRLANVDDLRNLRYDWRNHQRAPRTAVAFTNAW